MLGIIIGELVCKQQLLSPIRCSKALMRWDSTSAQSPPRDNRVTSVYSLPHFKKYQLNKSIIIIIVYEAMFFFSTVMNNGMQLPVFLHFHWIILVVLCYLVVVTVALTTAGLEVLALGLVWLPAVCDDVEGSLRRGGKKRTQMKKTTADAKSTHSVLIKPGRTRVQIQNIH